MHSFIATVVVKDIKPRTRSSDPLLITVADGGKMVSMEECPNFSWSMSGYEFKEKLRLLDLLLRYSSWCRLVALI